MSLRPPFVALVRGLVIALAGALLASCVHEPRPPRPRDAATTASPSASASGSLATAPPGVPAPKPPVDGVFSPGGGAAGDGSPAARVVPVPVTTQITRIASLVHFVDSLADTSGGKSIPTYRALWTARIGAPTEEDREAIRAYRAARFSATASGRCVDPPPGSVNANPGWSTRFLYAAMEAEDKDVFLADVSPCLTGEEARGLADALTHFEPGFEVFWRESGFLRGFERELQEYLQSGGLALYLGEVARWFGVDPTGTPAPVLALVVLPADGGTHAQALGRRLLIEIRPHDEPADQVAVVAHEESHYLFYQIPSARLEALEARAAAAGPHGRRVWQLLQEAIPTALGQGLAVARLEPGDFHPEVGWYHIPEVDALAHLIYPHVREGIDSGRMIDEDFIAACVRVYEEWDERRRHPPIGPER